MSLTGNDEGRNGAVEYDRMSDDELYLLLMQTRLDVAALLRKVGNINRQTIVAFLEGESVKSRGKYIDRDAV